MWRRSAGWLVVVGALVGVAARAEGLTEARAVALALERSPAVGAQAAEVRAAEARAGAVARLLADNPEVDVAAGPRTREGAATTLELGLSVSQAVEVGGQRGLRREAAAAGLRAARARLQAVRGDVVLRVREGHARALAAAALRRLADEGRGLAEETLAAARARHAAGDASRLEVNAARVEAGRAARAVARAAQAEAQALGALRLLLALDAGAPLEVAGTLEAPAAAAAPETQEARVQRALAARPEVAQAREALRAAEAEARLAGRSALPSPRLGAALAREEEATIVQGTLGFSLPLFARNQEVRAGADAALAQARLALAAAEREAVLDVALAHARLEAARATAEALTGPTLQAAEENATLAAEGYRAGEVDFVQLLLLRREALAARAEALEALEETHAAAAALQRALGEAPAP